MASHLLFISSTYPWCPGRQGPNTRILLTDAPLIFFSLCSCLAVPSRPGPRRATRWLGPDPTPPSPAGSLGAARWHWSAPQLLSHGPLGDTR
eukprot:9003358-Pyramimonas_sp.AAC.1